MNVSFNVIFISSISKSLTNPSSFPPHPTFEKCTPKKSCVTRIGLTFFGAWRGCKSTTLFHPSVAIPSLHCHPWSVRKGDASFWEHLNIIVGWLEEGWNFPCWKYSRFSLNDPGSSKLSFSAEHWIGWLPETSSCLGFSVSLRFFTGKRWGLLAKVFLRLIWGKILGTALCPLMDEAGIASFL